MFFVIFVQFMSLLRFSFPAPYPLIQMFDNMSKVIDGSYSVHAKGNSEAFFLKYWIQKSEFGSFYHLLLVAKSYNCQIFFSLKFSLRKENQSYSVLVKKVLESNSRSHRKRFVLQISGIWQHSQTPILSWNQIGKVCKKGPFRCEPLS